MALAIKAASLSSGYVDNTVTWLGSVPSGYPTLTNPGLALPSGYALPSNWTVDRRLDEHQDFVYRVVNNASLAPNFAIEMKELNNIQANDLIGVVTASQALLNTLARFLGISSAAVTQVTVQSEYGSQQAALRRLRPTDQTLFTYQAPPYINMSNLPLYVIQHTRKTNKGMTGAKMRTETILATILDKDRKTLDQLALDNSLAVKNIKRFGVGSAR